MMPRSSSANCGTRLDVILIFGLSSNPIWPRSPAASAGTANQATIADARSMVAFEIKHQVQRGEKYLDDAAAGDLAASDHFQEVYRVLLGLIGPEAEYSSAARAFLAGYRDMDWVVRALTTA